MAKFIAARIFAAIPVLLLTTVIVFSLMRMLPGDPVFLLLTAEPGTFSSEAMKELRTQFLLNRPLVEQYFIWLGRALSGNLGYSILSPVPVLEILEQRIFPTLQIGVTAWLISIVVALPLGISGALAPKAWKDLTIASFTLAGAAVPYFLSGGVLIFAFAVTWRFLPTSGYVHPSDGILESIEHTILPAIALSLGFIAVVLRQSRASFADVIAKDFIKTARMKGLPEWQVVLRHAVRVAILPVVTLLGIELGTLFSGAVVIETVFGVPGIGRLLVDSVLSRDYPVVSGVVLLIGIAIVLTNLLVDIMYGFLDPRTRQWRGGRD